MVSAKWKINEHKAAFGSRKSISGKYFIFRKGKCIQLFGCVEIRFTKNQFKCLVRTNILWKMSQTPKFLYRTQLAKLKKKKIHSKCSTHNSTLSSSQHQHFPTLFFNITATFYTEQWFHHSKITIPSSTHWSPYTSMNTV